MSDSRTTDMADLAAKITAAHEGAQAVGKGCIQCVVEAGKLFVEASIALPFGSLLPWVEANTPVKPRAVLEYMKQSRLIQTLDSETLKVVMELPGQAAITFLERLPALQQLSVKGQVLAVYLSKRLDGQPPVLQCEAMAVLAQVIAERGEQPDCFLEALLGLLGQPDFSTVGAATDQDFEEAVRLLEAAWKDFKAHEPGRH